MEAKKGKTIFLEYSSNMPNQHFMTVIQTKDHQRIIIGRIYREYNKEAKKTTYLATDSAGNNIFRDVKTLPELKRQYIEHGEQLAWLVPKTPNKSRQEGRLVIALKAERNNAINKIREKKSSKEKSKEISKTNPDGKANGNKKEKEQDSKNPERYKATEKSKEETNSKENATGQESPESNSEKPIQEEPMETEKSSREAELESIREQGDEKEQELEIDM